VSSPVSLHDSVYYDSLYYDAALGGKPPDYFPCVLFKRLRSAGAIMSHGT